MRWFKKWLLTSIGFISILALPTLAILTLPTASSGCFCDCGGTYNVFRLSSLAYVPIATLTIAGNACGDSRCQGSTSGGGCPEYEVQLKETGDCQLTATAIDGRQATVGVNVQYTKTTCCGKMYSVGANNINLPFAAPDAGPD